MTSSTRTGAAFGHPKGLYYLAFTETWERFSYYGMTSLLTLYMTKQLFLSGHAGNVLGLAALRHAFEFNGPMSDVAFASLIYGWYGGLVYLTPILGGLIADRWLGTKATVVVGALLMAGGHLAMAFDQSFLIALLLLILGSGCLKGNISAQVGQLYPQAAESLRTQGYTIFSAGINVGAVLGPLTCGGLAAAYGWHAGFGAAAGLMLLALAIYLAGQRDIPGGRRAGSVRVVYPPMTSDEWKRTLLLIFVAALTVFPNVAYPMIWSIGVLWIDGHVSLASAFGTVPASWFNSVDAFASIVAVPPLVALWGWQNKRGREPSDVEDRAGVAAHRAVGVVPRRRRAAAGGGWQDQRAVGAGRLLRDGGRVPLLLARPARADQPGRAQKGQRDADGGRFPVVLLRQRDRGMGRQFLRPAEPRSVLVDRRGDRDCRRADRVCDPRTIGPRARTASD
ncbi:MAG: oligopeptide:H+ symporter [Pseudomonadota bacterium]